MIQVRDVLQVKFGHIDQAVELFTSSTRPAFPYMAPDYQFNVLTDISGEMYTLVNEYVVPNLSDHETMRQQTFSKPEFELWFRQFEMFVEGGRREYYNIEGPYAGWSRPGMIVVRESYRVFKWQVKTAIGLLQRYGGLLVANGVGQNARILTDASGPMFRAVIEVETDSMSTWETQRRHTYLQTEFEVWFNQMKTTVEAGEHDFYRVEYANGVQGH